MTDVDKNIQGKNMIGKKINIIDEFLIEIERPGNEEIKEFVYRLGDSFVDWLFCSLDRPRLEKKLIHTQLQGEIDKILLRKEQLHWETQERKADVILKTVQAEKEKALTKTAIQSITNRDNIAKLEAEANAELTMAQSEVSRASVRTIDTDNYTKRLEAEARVAVLEAQIINERARTNSQLSIDKAEIDKTLTANFISLNESVAKIARMEAEIKGQKVQNAEHRAKVRFMAKALADIDVKELPNTLKVYIASTLFGGEADTWTDFELNERIKEYIELEKKAEAEAKMAEAERIKAKSDLERTNADHSIDRIRNFFKS